MVSPFCSSFSSTAPLSFYVFVSSSAQAYRQFGSSDSVITGNRLPFAAYHDATDAAHIGRASFTTTALTTNVSSHQDIEHAVRMKSKITRKSDWAIDKCHLWNGHILPQLVNLFFYNFLYFLLWSPRRTALHWFVIWNIPAKIFLINPRPSFLLTLLSF